MLYLPPITVGLTIPPSPLWLWSFQLFSFSSTRCITYLLLACISIDCLSSREKQTDECSFDGNHYLGGAFWHVADEVYIFFSHSYFLLLVLVALITYWIAYIYNCSVDVGVGNIGYCCEGYFNNDLNYGQCMPNSTTQYDSFFQIYHCTLMINRRDLGEFCELYGMLHISRSFPLPLVICLLFFLFLVPQSSCLSFFLLVYFMYQDLHSPLGQSC